MEVENEIDLDFCQMTESSNNSIYQIDHDEQIDVDKNQSNLENDNLFSNMRAKTFLSYGYRKSNYNRAVVENLQNIVLCAHTSKMIKKARNQRKIKERLEFELKCMKDEMEEYKKMQFDLDADNNNLNEQK